MRAWLHEHNFHPEERDFFAKPLTEAELRALLAGRPAAELFSWKSPAAKGLGLTPETATAEELIRLMLGEPRLIRRPILKAGQRLVIGADLRAMEEALEAVDLIKPFL
ncbi:MAG: hypothetical protein HY532_02710 [Chloroflexi bacterium]|nr:hypothetical protein [Chloroflexota bacterium]